MYPAVPLFLSSEVNDPITYEQLKSGEIEVGSYVTVFSSAKADIFFTEPKFFTAPSYKEVKFIDNDRTFNAVTMNIPEKKVTTDFQLGTDLTLGLPDNFTDYTLQFWKLALVSDADFNVLLITNLVKKVNHEKRRKMFQIQ